MEPLMHWTHCRREGCGKKLPASFHIYGFCNSYCFSMHREEKEVHTQNALAAFKREGEPNGGHHA